MNNIINRNSGCYKPHILAHSEGSKDHTINLPEASSDPCPEESIIVERGQEDFLNDSNDVGLEDESAVNLTSDINHDEDSLDNTGIDDLNLLKLSLMSI